MKTEILVDAFLESDDCVHIYLNGLEITNDIHPTTYQRIESEVRDRYMKDPMKLAKERDELEMSNEPEGAA